MLLPWLVCLSTGFSLDVSVLEVLGGNASEGLDCGHSEITRCAYDGFLRDVPEGLARDDIVVAFGGVHSLEVLFYSPPSITLDGALTFSLRSDGLGAYRVFDLFVILTQEEVTEHRFSLAVSQSMLPELKYQQTDAVVVAGVEVSGFTHTFAQVTGGSGPLQVSCHTTDVSLFSEPPSIAINETGSGVLSFAPVLGTAGTTTVYCTLHDSFMNTCEPACPITFTVTTTSLAFDPMHLADGESPSVGVTPSLGVHAARVFAQIRGYATGVHCTSSGDMFSDLTLDANGVLHFTLHSVGPGAVTVVCPLSVAGTQEVFEVMFELSVGGAGLIFEPPEYPVLRVGRPLDFSVSIAAAVTEPVTLVASAGPCVAFDPRSLTIPPGELTVAAQVTSSCSGTHHVGYSLSGAGGVLSAPSYPSALRVVDGAYGLRLSDATHVPKSVVFREVLPVVSVLLIDSDGVHDTHAVPVTVVAEASHGLLANTEAVMTKGVATFSNLMFHDHPTNPVLSFKAVARGYPVDGKAISPGVIAVLPVPAYSLQFSVPVAAGTAIAMHVPLPRVEVELLKSDGTRDLTTPGVVISVLASGGGLLAGNAAVVSAAVLGRAVFTDLRFLNFPAEPVLRFVAEGHDASLAPLETPSITVLPAVCGAEARTGCVCTGAVDGSLCDDTDAATIADACYEGACHGAVVEGYEVGTAVSWEEFHVVVHGSWLPSGEAGDRFWVAAGSCASTWLGTSNVTMLPGPSTSQRVSRPITLTSASQSLLTACYDVDGSGPEAPVVVKPLGAPLIVSPQPPVITSLSSASCVNTPPAQALSSCTDGLLTVIGRHFDSLQANNEVVFGGSAGAAPHCTVVSLGVQLVCMLRVPAGASGDWSLSVRVLGTASVSVPLHVVNPTPVVQELEMTTCAVSGPSLLGCQPGVLSMSGLHFANVPSRNLVIFKAEGSGTPTCAVTYASATQIRCSLEAPEGMVGVWSVHVVVGGVESLTGLSLELSHPPPVLTSISSPTCEGHGLVVRDCSGMITLIGQGFGGVLESNTVTVEGDGDGVLCLPTAVHDGTQLLCILSIPEAAHGVWSVRVAVQGANSSPLPSNAGTLEISARPFITDAQTTCAAGSCTLALHGSDFDAVPARNIVALFGGSAPNGQPACEPYSVVREAATNAMRLLCTVTTTPSTADDWSVTVAVGTHMSNAMSVTLSTAPPTITSLNMDTCASVSSHVLSDCEDGNLVINGLNFDPREGRNSVSFVLGSGNPPFCRDVFSPSAGTLVCALSSHAGTVGAWKVVISTDTAESTSVAVLTLRLAVPIVKSIEGAGCVLVGDVYTSCTGGLLKLHGTHFGAALERNAVSFVTPSGAPSQGTTCEVVAGASSLSTVACLLSTSEEAGTWYPIVKAEGLSSASTLSIRLVPAPVILGLSSPDCKAVGALTLHYCTGGAVLRVSGNNFAPDAVRNTVLLSLDGLDTHCVVLSAARTVLEFRLPTVLLGGYNLTVVVDGVASASGAVVSHVSTLVPVVRTMAGGGCNTEGLSSGECVGGLLVFTGQALQVESAELRVEVDFTEGDGTPPTCLVTDSSTTVLQCELDISGAAGPWKVRLVVRDALGGVQHASQEDVTMQVSRTPRVTLVQGGGCNHISTSELSACVGGTLSIMGTGFNAASATRNVVEFMPTTGTGHPPVCATVSATLKVVQCKLEVPTGSSGTWQLMVSNDGGHPSPLRASPSITLGETLPIVNGISGGGCSAGGDVARSACRGGILVIHGDHFIPVYHMNAVLFVAHGASGSPPKCLPIPLGSGVSTLMCRLSSPVDIDNTKWTVVVESSGLAGTSHVTLEAVHAPVVFNISGGGCLGHGTQCVGGQLLLTGDNFGQSGANDVRFVGGDGQPPVCTVMDVFTTSLSCELRTHGDTSGVWSILVVSAGVSSALEEAPTVELIPPPVVLQVTGGGCTSAGDALVSCRGGLLVVSGAHFSADYTLLEFVPLGPGTQHDKPKCTSLVVSHDTIRCALHIPSASVGLWRLLTVSRSVVAEYTPVLDVVPNPPVVLMLSGGGCTGVGGALSQCKGGRLVITGQSFNTNANATHVAFSGSSGSEPTCEVLTVAETEIHCQLVVPPGSAGTWSVQVVTQQASQQVLTIDAAPELVVQRVSGGGCNSEGALVLSQCTGTRLMDTRPLGGHLVVQCNALDASAVDTAVIFQGPDPVPMCNVVSVTHNEVTCTLQMSARQGVQWELRIINKGMLSGQTTVKSYVAGLPLVLSAEGSCEARRGAMPSNDLILCREGPITVHGTSFHPFDERMNAVQVKHNGAAVPGVRCDLRPASMWLTGLVCDLRMASVVTGSLRLYVGGSLTSIALQVFVPEEPAGPIVSTTVALALAHDIDSFDTGYWRYLCARALSTLFGVHIAAARVVIASLREGSTIVEVGFAEGEGPSAGELGGMLLQAVTDAEVRASLGVTHVEGGEDKDLWLTSYWWVLVLAVVLLLLLVCIAFFTRGSAQATQATPEQKELSISPPPCFVYESDGAPTSEAHSAHSASVQREVTPPNPLQCVFPAEDEQMYSSSGYTDSFNDRSMSSPGSYYQQSPERRGSYTGGSYDSRGSYTSSMQTTPTRSYSESYSYHTDSYE